MTNANWAIELVDLHKHFGNLHAVDGLSFKVARGELFCLLGPNGAGKTTVTRILTTIARPTSGAAWVAGFDVGRDPMAVRQRIGVMAQTNNLDQHLTAYENLYLHAMQHRLSRQEAKHRIEELLDFMALAQRAHDFPDTFSGGMQRRLAFARALVHQPEILFLDEPTTGLDPQSRSKVWNFLSSHRSGMTIFLTTHYIHEAERLADHILIIDHGRPLREGTPKEIQATVHKTSVYELDLGEMAGQIENSLKQQSFVAKIERRKNVLEIHLNDRNDLARVLELVPVRALRRLQPHQPTLEEVFLRLTGKKLRDG
jgi:ABC-2 type transport system ATP-binding protein